MAKDAEELDKKGEGEKIIYTIPQPVALPRLAQNYAVLNLDGSADDVKASWSRTILQFRLWCFNNTDERFQFGMTSRSSCVLPKSGHFLVYIHYQSSWLCAVIDGPSGYLDGYITRSKGKQKDVRAKENIMTSDKSKSQAEPIYITGSALLPWGGNYKDADRCKMGHSAMISSFKVMHQHVDSLVQLQPNPKVVKAGQTLILHLPEAARSDELFYHIHSNFHAHLELGIERLNAARHWKKDCLAARLMMLGMIRNRFGVKQEIAYVDNSSKKAKKTVSKEEAQSIVRNFRLFHRPDHTHCIFNLEKMPVHLAADGPTNNQWAKKNLSISPNCDSATKFLIQRMTDFPSINIKVKGGEHENDPMPARPIAHPHQCTEVIVTGCTGHIKVKGSEDESDPVSARPTAHPQQCTEGHFATHVGLKNLGNTCYVNSAIQCLRAVPELKSMLKRYSDDKDTEIDQKAHDLTIESRNLLEELDKSDKVVAPVHFLQVLREKCQQFQRQEGGSYMQQDVEELWTQLLSTFSETLVQKENEPFSMDIKDLFGIDFIRRFHCVQTGEENYATESLYFWKCYISSDGVKHLHQGLKHGMKSECMKISPRLGSNVAHTEDLKISVLPRYLCVQIIRYIWESEQSSKILSKVDYPAVLNVHEYCSDELREELNAAQQRSLARAGRPSNMDIDKANSSVAKNQVTGIYDLVVVLTHQGQTPKSGHYIGWVKQENANWVEFDDGKTRLHQKEEILKLSGGCRDEHMAYICLYRARVI